jgi:hypothetical protein
VLHLLVGHPTDEDVRRPPATGHASAPGGGRPSNRAPLVDVVARRRGNQGGATVVLGDDGLQEWRREAQITGCWWPARGAAAGNNLPETWCRTSPALMLLTISTTPSRCCLPNLPLPVSSLSSFHNPKLYAVIARFMPYAFCSELLIESPSGSHVRKEEHVRLYTLARSRVCLNCNLHILTVWCFGHSNMWILDNELTCCTMNLCAYACNGPRDQNKYSLP